MNPEVTLRKFPVSAEEIEAAIAAAPEQAEDLECPYDPNDAEQVKAYWQNATVVREGGTPPYRPHWLKGEACAVRAPP